VSSGFQPHSAPWNATKRRAYDGRFKDLMDNGGGDLSCLDAKTGAVIHRIMRRKKQ